MEKEGILIKLIEEKFDTVNEKFDVQRREFNENFKELKEDNEKLNEKIDNIEKNHIKHLELEIENLKGSFSIIKPIGYTIASGVVVAVLKYLFFP